MTVSFAPWNFTKPAAVCFADAPTRWVFSQCVADTPTRWIAPAGGMRNIGHRLPRRFAWLTGAGTRFLLSGCGSVGGGADDELGDEPVDALWRPDVGAVTAAGDDLEAATGQRSASAWTVDIGVVTSPVAGLTVVVLA